MRQLSSSFIILETMIAARYRKTAQELPEQDWETVARQPTDISMANRKRFNTCTIQTDPAISGGMVAESMNGKIVVNNTFEKRLESSWPTFFPAIVRELETEYVESGNFTESTSK